MLLHKKQRRCQLLAAYAVQMSHEAQSQGELEREMLDQQVGREVVDYPVIGEEEEEGG